MYELPTTVTVKDRTFHIRNNGDFRMVLDCFSALQDEEMSEDYRVLASLLIFYNEFTDISDLREVDDCVKDLASEMFRFMNLGQDQAPGADSGNALVDWEGDSQMICAAINNVAKTEIRSVEYLHWWTFLGYYMSVGQSVLSTVIGIRDKMCRHKKLEKWEQEFKRNNPKYFVWKRTSVQDRELENLVRELWNNGGNK